MTEKGFGRIVEHLEGAYRIEFSDGTKEAWWTVLKGTLDDIGMKAAIKLTTDPTLFAPNLGKLMEYVNGLNIMAERAAWKLPEDGGVKILNSLAKTTREVLHDKLWRPHTALQREGAMLFCELVHQAHGLFDDRRGATPAGPKINQYGLEALESVNGFEGVRDLGSHDVLMAREWFTKAYEKAATPAPPQEAA